MYINLQPPRHVMKYQILSKKKAKKINDMIENQWGTRLDDSYVFLENEGDIFITSRAIENIPFENLRVNAVGLYIAEIKHNTIRLSIEGSQLIGPSATRNVLEIQPEHVKAWVKGEDIPADSMEGFVIIKSGDDFLGCGKAKENKVLNYVPKARRVKETHIE